MPGFAIANIGGNGPTAYHEARFYASYSWDMPDITSIVGKMLSTNNTTGKRVSTILLKSAQLPSAVFDIVKAKGGAQDYKFAGKPTFDDVKITFYDTYGLSFGLKQWFESVYNLNDGLRTANHYKINTTIKKSLMDAELNETEDDAVKSTGTVYYNLYGAWPKVIKESDLTYVEASIKTVDVILCYDHFVMSEPD